MTEDEVKAALTDLDALTLTMWAEAAGDTAEGRSSVEERIAVGCVIRNRVQKPERYGDSYRAVCLARKQFSCWNHGTDANHVRLMALAEALIAGQPVSLVVQETRALARLIMTGVLLDRVSGAVSYYAPKAMLPKGAKPKWIFKNGTEVQPVAVVGTQRFYANV